MVILPGELGFVPLTVVRIESGDNCLINSNNMEVGADELDNSSWRLLLDNKFLA